MGSARARLAGTVASLLVALGAAPAAGAELSLRIEGAASTLFEGPITPSAEDVDGGDGSGPHPCRAGASPAGALATASAESGFGWHGTWTPDFQDFFIDAVGPDATEESSNSYWSVLVDWRYAVGACRAAAPAGSEVLFAYASGASPEILRLTGASRAALGEPVTVSVRDGWIRASTGLDGGPVEGASVGGKLTGRDGTAVVRFETAGLKRLKATRPGAIRSNELDICVGDAHCEGALPPPLEEPRLVEAEFSVPGAGERYARGGAPRLLRGSADGPASLSLEGRRGGRCLALADSGALLPRPCEAPADPVPLAVEDGAWRQSIRGRVPPGRYRAVLATATGRRVVRSFQVAAAPSSARAAARAAAGWLARVQNPGGGFGSAPGQPAGGLFTGWAAIGLSQAGSHPAALARARGRLRAIRPRTLADIERHALALASSRDGVDRTTLRRLRSAIAHRQRRGGSWKHELNATAYALIALHGGRHHAVEKRGRAWLRKAAAPADADTLAAVLWALRPDRPGRRALDFLRSAQASNGGIAARPGGDPNVQSTALAVAGLSAAGHDPRALRSNVGISPVDYLRAGQRPGGAVAYRQGQWQTPVWTTAQALLALSTLH